MFREAVIFIQHELLKAKKTRKFQCIHPKYHGSKLNNAFATNLEYLLCSENVKYWIHGHTHSSIDITIDGCRIIANPKGYAKENDMVNKSLVLEILN